MTVFVRLHHQGCHSVIRSYLDRNGPYANGRLESIDNASGSVAALERLNEVQTGK